MRSGSSDGCGRSSWRRPRGRRGGARRTPPARGSSPGRSCGRRRRSRRPTPRARAGKSGSKRRNMNRAQAGMFDQMARPSAPSGAMSPVETSSGTTISTRPSIVSGSGGTGGGGDDVRGPARARPRRLLGRGRRDDLAVVDAGPGGGIGESSAAVAELARVGDLAAQRGRGRRRRRAEVDAVVRGAAAAGEVAVERADRDRARRRAPGRCPMHGPQAGSRMRAPAREQVASTRRCARSGRGSGGSRA